MKLRSLISPLLALLFLAGLLVVSTPVRAPAKLAETLPVTSETINAVYWSTPTGDPTIVMRGEPSTAASTWQRNAHPTPTANQFFTIHPTARPTQTSVLIPRPLAARAVPLEAEVKGMYGYGQLMPLSCESRSAADWARHFGVTIHELEFFQKLPKASNPEDGFVGDVNGGWGNLPPGAYGVHAGPVARLLRDYGVQARAMRHMSVADLKGEIAEGRPVMIWVTGHVEPGKGQTIQIEDRPVLVARYEHTVIVIGYNQKEVTILDGKNVYKRPWETFEASWSALDSMAIIGSDE